MMLCNTVNVSFVSNTLLKYCKKRTFNFYDKIKVVNADIHLSKTSSVSWFHCTKHVTFISVSLL